LRAIAPNEVPLALTPAAYPPSPAPIDSTSGGSRAGEFETRPRTSWDLAWTSSTSQTVLVTAQASGGPGCVAGGVELLLQACGGASMRPPGYGASLLPGADARGIVSRRAPFAPGASGARYGDAPMSVATGSGSGAGSGGSSSSAAGAPAFGFATLLLPAALLLLAAPRVMRRPSLACEQSFASAFALIPERPG
jgi:hypothetical protein